MPINKILIRVEKIVGDKQYYFAGISVVANIFSRVIALVVMAFSIRWTLSYLGETKYGIWMTIASFVGMLSFLDAGIGNALVARVGKVEAISKKMETQSAISGGIGLLIIIGIIVSSALLLASYYIPWGYVLNINDSKVETEAKNAIMIFSFMFGINIIVGGAQKVFIALQKAYYYHVVSIVGSLLALMALYSASNQKANLSILLMCTMGIPLAVNLSLILVLSNRGYFHCAKIVQNIKKESSELLGVGGLFFILQIGTMIAWGGDNLIVSKFLGVQYVAAFSVVQQIYQIILQPVGIFSNSLWGVYAQASARHEWSYIRKTLISSIKYSILYSLAVYVIISLVGRGMIGKWTNGRMDIGLELILAYGLWACLYAFTNVYSVFLNGCSIIAPQVLHMVLVIGFGIPVKIYIASNFGLDAMIVSFAAIFAISMALSHLLVYGQKIKKYLRG